MNQFLVSKKELKDKKSKIWNQIDQQRGCLLPDTIGLEEKLKEHAIIDRNIHELRDEIFNQI